MTSVVVVVLSLVVLFLGASVIDYWHRWRSEKLWAEYLKGLLDLTRQELVLERQKWIAERSNDGTAED